MIALMKNLEGLHWQTPAVLCKEVVLEGLRIDLIHLPLLLWI